MERDSHRGGWAHTSGLSSGFQVPGLGDLRTEELCDLRLRELGCNNFDGEAPQTNSKGDWVVFCGIFFLLFGWMWIQIQASCMLHFININSLCVLRAQITNVSQLLLKEVGVQMRGCYHSAVEWWDQRPLPRLCTGLDTWTSLYSADTTHLLNSIPHTCEALIPVYVSLNLWAFAYDVPSIWIAFLFTLALGNPTFLQIQLNCHCEPGSPSLQADYLPAELLGKPLWNCWSFIYSSPRTFCSLPFNY